MKRYKFETQTSSYLLINIYVLYLILKDLQRYTLHAHIGDATQGDYTEMVELHWG